MVLVTAWLALRLSGQSKTLGPSTLEDAVEFNTHVALVETGGSHDEVTAALYYAIGSVPCVYTSMYLALPRFGIENVYAWIRRRYKLSPYSISQPFLFHGNDTVAPPDAIILATCEHDVYAVDRTLQYHFEHGSKYQTLVCVIHHVDGFRSVEERVRRWARAGRLRFLTLSTHTAHELRKEVNEFGQVYQAIDIDVFPPVFPVPFNPTPSTSDKLSIAIQGNFEDTRRDYLKTLLNFERMIEELPEPIVSRIHFTLAGTGKKVGVPAKVMPYISVNFSLDFIPYYNLLHESFALIPAFADEAYYSVKASSSVAASLIANTPILGSQRLLDSYGYLTRESMWHVEAVEQSEMNAVYELLRQHFDDDGHERSSWKSAVNERKQAAKTRALELMKENARLMQDIVLKQGSTS